MYRWKLEDAKNRFSEVVRRALAQGPQLVTRYGHAAVVVVAVQEYERLLSQTGLVQFLRSSPLAEALAADALDLERHRELGREVTL